MPTATTNFATAVTTDAKSTKKGRVAHSWAGGSPPIGRVVTRRLFQRFRDFLAAVRAGDPRATWISQTLPLPVLIPTTIWLAADSGTVLPAALTFVAGAVSFNIWWAPHMRRNEHPPAGSAQSIATATVSASTLFAPEAGPLFVGFGLMGIALGIANGGRWHQLFQSVCVYAAGFSLVGTDALTLRAWLIFALLGLPMTYSAISFAVAEKDHRERLLDSVLVSSGGTAWDVCDEGKIRSILGIGFRGVEVDKALSDLIHDDDERPRNPKPGATLEYRLGDGDGGWRWIRESVDTAPSSRTAQRSVVVDITDEKMSQELDRLRANRDELTGQPNRASHIQIAEEWAEQGTGSLIIVDLDDFKHINDTLGHSTGDRVLREAAERLAAAGPGIHVARLGGDEFACLIDGDPDGVQQVANELITRLIEPFSIDSIVVYSGACAGFAEFVPGEPADEIRRRAGVALREAKTSGNTALEYDEQLEEQSAKQKALAIDLPAALQRGDIIVHFQPKLDLSTRRVIGYEALARWQHSEQGLLEPSVFMDLIALSGLHTELYRVVLEQALFDLATLRTSGADVTVSVNVDARNLREPDLASRTLALVEMYGLEPKDLILELTEEVLVGEDPALTQALTELDEAGVTLSIDDFGSGFSSLAYLTRLPIREMKLDRSLVSQVPRSSRAKAILESVFGVASRLGLVVVAEGVERQETLEYLATQGCLQGQGYLIGKPNTASYWAEQPTDIPLDRAS